MAHSVAFFVFSVTLVWGWTSGFKRAISIRDAGWLWVIAVLYGLSDEYHQSFIAGRSPAIEDAVSDGLGALVGLLASWLAVRWSHRQP